MRIAFDTEFIEDGITIDLVSIGMIREDGKTYYAETAEADYTKASDWVKEHVFPNLTGRAKDRQTIAAEIIEFAGPEPEFWAWYADYDWVALCQLYGRMIDLPKGWPMYCRDFKQTVDMAGWKTFPSPDSHNALEDAVWLAGEMDRLNG